MAFFWGYARHVSHHALSVLPFLFEPGNIAYALATGQGFASPLRVPSGPTAWVAPVYPGLLALLFHLFGVYAFGAFVAAVALNIVFSTLTCWPIFALGRRLAGPAAAALAAWLWALYPNAILLTYQSMWPGCLAALLAATALWGIVVLADPAGLPARRQHRGAGVPACPNPPSAQSPSAASPPRQGVPSAARWLPWVAYGLLWGLILLTDPTLMVLVPLWLGWWLWRHRSGRAAAAPPYEASLPPRNSPSLASCRHPRHGSLPPWRGPAIAIAVTIACVVPWTVRNHRVLHAWVPVRSDLGLALWLGNNPQATYMWRGQRHPLDNARQRALYLRQGEVPYMRRKLKRAVDYIAAHPARVVALSWRRFLAFWSGGSPFPIRALARSRSNWSRYVLLFDLLAGLAALGGIWRLVRRHSPYVFPLAVVVLVVPCAYYLTLAVPRYRLPVDPAFLLLAALLFLPPPAGLPGRPATGMSVL